jgi:hypothetical protein|tara:strand:- start:23 stop:253 length:231 start_codon:yes stop_codon:yes gene_type:complete
MDLTAEQLAILNHIVIDGQVWADNALKDEHILAKIARHKQSYFDNKASLGSDYKTRKEQQEADDTAEQDRLDKAHS